MRTLIWIVVLTTALTAVKAAADASRQAGATAYAVCASCHGPAAGGNPALRAPRLNHLDPVYIAAQLDKFRRGIRGGKGATPEAAQMAGMAGTLAGEQAVQDVSAYIASLDSTAPEPTVEGDPRLGADYYNQFCGACHGPAAEGNTALNSPALAGADDWYLLAQLGAFRDGVRGAHPEDRTGKQMRAMAGVLPDEQAMRDVVTFIGSLAP